MTSSSAARYHWAVIESPLGVAGVICGEGGRVARVILPCSTAEETRKRIQAALQDLARPPRGAAGRIEEKSKSSSPAGFEPGTGVQSAPAPQALENGEWTREAKRQIEEYLSGRRRTFELPVDLAGVRGFGRQALEAAAQIPFGQTRSYWWVSVRAGNPRAARAVGQAMACNPVPLVIPCHRVVRSDGSLGGFGGGGPEQKRRLINLESQ